MSINKTVYILGAGFSIDAGGPSQGEIIKEIFDLKNFKISSKFIKSREIVDEWIDEFEKFIIESLNISDTHKYWYSLEDIYTPIDKSIAEGTSYREYSTKELIDLRDKFNKLIIIAVRNSITRKKRNKDYIERFAQNIIERSKRKLNNEKNDEVAVITTNWDILLDNITYKIISEETIPQGHEFSGVVDYCCNISSLDENDNSIKPGLYAIGKGRYNVKILKVHGSLNWLQCPKCLRIYVKFYKKWNGGYVFDQKYCRHCEDNFQLNCSESNRLLTNLIMPTYLKKIENVQHNVTAP